MGTRYPWGHGKRQVTLYMARIALIGTVCRERGVIKMTLCAHQVTNARKGATTLIYRGAMCKMVVRVRCTLHQQLWRARQSVTICAARQIALKNHGTTTRVLVGPGAKRTPTKHAIVYFKVRLCRLRAQHTLGIPCMAPIVKKNGTKCQEHCIMTPEKHKIVSVRRERSAQKSATGDTRIGASSR